MSKKLIACLTCLLICSTTFSADWKLKTFTDEYFIYIDSESLKPNKNLSTLDFWYKAVARKNIFEQKVYKGDYGLFYEVLNCREKTIATKSYVTYKANGAIKESQSTDDLLFEPLVPESIGEIFLDLCTSTPNSTTDINQKSKKIDI